MTNNKGIVSINFFKIAARVAMSELIIVNIEFPATMSVTEAAMRAQKLFPCKTSGFELEQVLDGSIIGNMSCDSKFYRKSGDFNEYGPDEAGVLVTWEKP